jgi:DNA-binding transcriptional ArsR family regulator
VRTSRGKSAPHGTARFFTDRLSFGVSTDLAGLYAALGDSTRCRIIERLSHGEATVRELRAPLPMTAPAVSRHLRVLEEAGLIERRRRGRLQVCWLRGERLLDARRWLEVQTEFWTGTLTSLGDYLDQEPS